MFALFGYVVVYLFRFIWFGVIVYVVWDCLRCIRFGVYCDAYSLGLVMLVIFVLVCFWVFVWVVCCLDAEWGLHVCVLLPLDCFYCRDLGLSCCSGLICFIAFQGFVGWVDFFCGWCIAGLLTYVVLEFVLVRLILVGCSFWCVFAMCCYLGFCC